MIRILILLPVLAVSLSGCQLFNRGKVVPDEFAVVSKPPLTVPPEYSLLPPRPGEASAQLDTSQQAQAALFGADAVADASDAEQALVAQAGGIAADPAIRRQLDREIAGTVYKDRSFADRILFWRGAGDAGVALDAAEEAERLEAINNATGGGEVEIERSRGVASKLPGL